MLNIINNLSPFFEDCYRRVSVREYARIMHISPPTASKLLVSYAKEGLLLKVKDRNYLFFYAHVYNKTFTDLSRIYWSERLKALTDFINKRVLSPNIVLFGSLAKAEAKLDSDVDMAIFGHKRNIDISDFEKKLKRKVQIFWFSSLKDVSPEELAINILNGYTLAGKLRA